MLSAVVSTMFHKIEQTLRSFTSELLGPVLLAIIIILLKLLERMTNGDPTKRLNDIYER